MKKVARKIKQVFNQQDYEEEEEEQLQQFEEQKKEEEPLVKYTSDGKAIVNVLFKGSNAYELMLNINQGQLQLTLSCKQNMFNQWISDISLDIEFSKQPDLKELCEGLSLKEFQSGLIDYIQNQQYQITSLENGSAVIEFQDKISFKKMMKTIEQEKTFSFVLNQEDLIDQNQIKVIGAQGQNIVTKLQDRIIQIENSNKILKESISFALEHLDITIEELREYKKNPFSLGLVSNILKAKDINQFFIQNLPKVCRLKKPTLLFRASQDGFNSQTFHNKCDNKGPYIFAIKTTNYGIIGGYCPDKNAFSNHGQYQVTQQGTDNQPFIFLFSGSQKSKCTLKQEQKTYTYYANNSYGPAMGGNHDLLIQLNHKTFNFNIGHSYNPHNLKHNTISGQQFTEFEVIKL